MDKAKDGKVVNTGNHCLTTAWHAL